MTTLESILGLPDNDASSLPVDSRENATKNVQILVWIHQKAYHEWIRF